MFIEEKNMIRLTDTDGIQFDLDINAVDEVLAISDAGADIRITGGERISVREPAIEVTEKIIKARYGA
ncbi:MAG: hypothetical protein J6K77_07430 [Ruminococcus sp.]|nr:hypothetical protein [Ruminococcus sp.]